MALKLSLLKQLRRQREDEVGNSTGTYFAIGTMALLLLMVSIYFWISNGHQLIESPLVQQDEHLTPHDAH